MLRDLRTELIRLLLPASLLLLIGWAIGAPTQVMLLGTLVYLSWHISQLHRLSRWLHRVNYTASDSARAEQNEPPESSGLWGNLFDGIYRLQRRERQAAARLEHIVQKARESSAALELAVIMIDADGRLVWWNEAGDKLLGLHASQDRKQTITNLIRDPRFIEYFEKENFSDPLKLPSPVDPAMILEFQITLFGEGERLMLVRNITQLQKLELMRKDFVANVSHELRTPLTVINGYLETILDNKTDAPPQWLKPLEQMQQQSHRMENIVRDLLTLSKLETSSVSRRLTRIDLNILLREIGSDAERFFTDRQHTYNFKCDTIAIRGNRGELYSAISNLVFNAAKYTQVAGQVTLKCYVEDGNPLVEIEDNGPGIEEQHIPRLTERFYRVDESRSLESGGTGLGLAIVKHVLARHGATLHISSKVGSGSRFACVFPPERLL